MNDTKNKISLPAAILAGAVIIGLAIIVTRLPHKERADSDSAPAQSEIAGYVESIMQKPFVLDVQKVSASDHIRGAAQPKVTIVEYSDLECPFCKRFHGTMQQIMEKYGDRVAWVYRHYPLDCEDNDKPNCTVLHPDARLAAIASECAANTGGSDAFWKFVDMIFAQKTTDLSKNTLVAIGISLGLDKSTFASCIDNHSFAAHISADAKSGQAIGVGGTPFSIVIDNTTGKMYSIEGAYPYEVVSAVIEKLTK
jgi:protein-disulfide isomerase